MAVVGLQTAIWSNRWKTLLLLALFPALLFGVLFLGFFFSLSQAAKGCGLSATPYAGQSEAEVAIPEACPSSLPMAAVEDTSGLFVFVGPALLVWALISFAFHRQIIFAFTGARAIARQENPEIYNIVENLCISRGLPTPNIGILDDDSLNAFAVGWNPKKCWIVFSRGLLEKLDRPQIEAVAGHELTHILNKDGLLMVTIIVFIGAVAGIGEIIFRMGLASRPSNRDSKDNSGTVFLLVGGAMLVLGYCILPIVQLAVSRRREYLADAGSVELTKDRDAMIGALRAISRDSAIESIQKDTVSALCIANPFPQAAGLFSGVHEFFSTHPSMEHRIELLEKY